MMTTRECHGIAPKRVELSQVSRWSGQKAKFQAVRLDFVLLLELYELGP